MTLPNGVTTCVVTFGRATSYLGNDAVISGVLSADRTIVHAASGVRIGPGDDVVPNESGFLSFSVPHVNQSGMVDGAGNAITGWFYILSGVITYPSGKPEPFRRVFQVLVGQTSIDLDLIADGPVLPTFTAPSAVVTSVAGLTGAVTAEDLAGAVGERDTGCRRITEPVDGEPDKIYTLTIRRVGSRVDYSFVTGAASATYFPAVIPAGFRPTQGLPSTALATDVGNGALFTAAISTSGELEYSGGITLSGSGVSVTGSYFTDDAFPDAEDYPGDPFPS